MYLSNRSVWDMTMPQCCSNNPFNLLHTRIIFLYLPHPITHTILTREFDKNKQLLWITTKRNPVFLFYKAALCSVDLPQSALTKCAIYRAQTEFRELSDDTIGDDRSWRPGIGWRPGDWSAVVPIFMGGQSIKRIDTLGIYSTWYVSRSHQNNDDATKEEILLSNTELTN